MSRRAHNGRCSWCHVHRVFVGRLHWLCARWKYGYVSVDPVLLRVAREGATAHRFRWTQRRLDVIVIGKASTVYDIFDPSQMIWPGGILLTYDMRLTTVTVKRGLIDSELYGSLVVAGKYKTGLRLSGSGVAGKIGGG